MSHQGNSPSLGRFEYGIIKRKMRQLVGKSGFTAQDGNDIEQELLLRVVQALTAFEPESGDQKAFTTAIVERAVANMLRNARAKKRDHRRVTSLNILIELDEEGPTELADTIGDREQNNRRCRHPRGEEVLRDLALDVADLVAGLPEVERDLAERLMWQSISEIARETGIARSTLDSRRRRIRQRFENTELRKYL